MNDSVANFETFKGTVLNERVKYFFNSILYFVEKNKRSLKFHKLYHLVSSTKNDVGAKFLFRNF